MGVNDRAFLRPRISQSQTLRGFLFCWGINNSNKLPNDEAIEAGAWNRRETKILQGEGSGTRLSAIIITVSLFIRSNRDTVICRARISKCSQGSLNYTRPMNLSWEFNWWKNTRAYIYIFIYSRQIRISAIIGGLRMMHAFVRIILEYLILSCKLISYSYSSKFVTCIE